MSAFIAELGELRLWARGPSVQAAIARLLLMRRMLRPLPRPYEPWRFRMLGAIVPDIDGRRTAEPDWTGRSDPFAESATALLAGVAIVERAGPEMLKTLAAE